MEKHNKTKGENLPSLWRIRIQQEQRQRLLHVLVRFKGDEGLRGRAGGRDVQVRCLREESVRLSMLLK